LSFEDGVISVSSTSSTGEQTVLTIDENGVNFQSISPDGTISNEIPADFEALVASWVTATEELAVAISTDENLTEEFIDGSDESGSSGSSGSVNDFYQPDYSDSFICSEPGTGGMTTCADIPINFNKSQYCNSTIELLFDKLKKNQVNSNEMNCFNSFYTKCRRSNENPFNGAISFDNIGYAWISIFQIITLENWSPIMYYLQDSHSFWNWIYFVFLILVINLILFTSLIH
jgi:hypothetical protein